jgi:hypothetical protein
VRLLGIFICLEGFLITVLSVLKAAEGAVAAGQQQWQQQWWYQQWKLGRVLLRGVQRSTA